MRVMETACLSSEMEAATIEVRRREINILARGIGDWLAGIVSSVELCAVRRGDLSAVHRELEGVERRLERLTAEVVLDR
jgi:hypothetical protein